MESATPGTAIEAPPPLPGGVVPYWHTALLLAVLLLFSLANAKTGVSAHAVKGLLHLYIGTMIYEWLLTAFVWWGLRRAGLSLRAMIGGRWHTVGDFFLDVVLAAGTWLGALFLLALAAFAMGLYHHTTLSDAQKQIGFLAPRSMLEVVIWVCLSATAGFCEEILFRGYFQMQFTRLLRNQWIALIVVSILFGLGHGYEGAPRMALVALLGFVFGLLSLLRKSLRPAMMAHTLQDTVSGLLMRALH